MVEITSTKHSTEMECFLFDVLLCSHLFVTLQESAITRNGTGNKIVPIGK
jgi:hypothetical protein